MHTNQVIVSGYVGNQPEPRLTTRHGIATTRLALAQTEVFWKDEERMEKTHWFQIICYGRIAETAVQHVAKGTRLVVSGRLASRVWHDQDSGRDQSITEIIAHNLEISRWPKDRDVSVDAEGSLEINHAEEAVESEDVVESEHVVEEVPF